MMETETDSEKSGYNYLQMLLWSIGISYVQLCFSYCHEPNSDLELNQWKYTTRKWNQQQNKNTMGGVPT